MQSNTHERLYTNIYNAMVFHSLYNLRKNTASEAPMAQC